MQTINRKITNFKKEITIAKTMYPRDFYKFYEMRSEKDKKIKSVSYTVYVFILTSFFKKLIKEMLESSYVYKFPRGMGYMAFYKRKTKGVVDGGEFDLRQTTYYKDWEKTKESRKKEGNETKIIYNLDIDYKIGLDWRKGRLSNIMYYYLKPSGEINRLMYYMALNGKHNKIDEKLILHNRESK